VKKTPIYIAVFILMLIGIMACTKTKTKNHEIYEAMFDLESEFWIKHSLAHNFLNRLLSKETQVVWSTNFHTAAPVPIGAVGPQKYTNMLKGIIQNDSIGRVMKMAVEDKVNVILVVGDGMGNMHMALPVYAQYAVNKNEKTYFEKIMAEGSCGYVYTGTARGLVTGSAASGTAIASGQKTLMNMVGVDTCGVALESVALVAKRNGFKTAIVTDASITDATPAAFYAHQHNRNLESEIALDLLNSNIIDIILGGGASYFIPSQSKFSDMTGVTSPNDYRSERKDSLNLIDAFVQNSYQFCYNKDQLDAAANDQKIIGLFAGGGLPPVIDRDAATYDIPTVLQMGKKAIDAVSQDGASYFVMIECARIDWEAHDNDLGAVYAAMQEMHNILEMAYQQYKDAPDNTLLIFLSDHETGGLEIAYRKMDDKNWQTKALSDGKTWTNNTNPLAYSDFVKNITKPKKSISHIFAHSTTAEALKINIEKYLGHQLSTEEAELLYFSFRDYQKYKD
jgi:alkaline phosphatase